MQAGIRHRLAALKREFNSAMILIPHDPGVVVGVAGEKEHQRRGRHVDALR
jgi:ABC-type dipeptide/oligopeptide/nickel transport system ATPase component